jgi:uncharacterized protein (TIGR00255 family)
MAVYSMTGFGSATASGSNDTVDTGGNTPASPQTATPAATPSQGSVTVEVRSVNGRFLDLTIKTPEDVRSLEGPLRELLTSSLKRGKVELRVNMQRDGEGAVRAPSPEQLMQLAHLESTVHGFFSKAAPLSVHEVLTWCRQAPAAARSDDQTLAVAKQAIAAMVAAREREGDRLADALKASTKRIRHLASQAQPLVQSVVTRQQQRFLERWHEALGAAAAAADISPTVTKEAAQERALGEAAAYALRIDVAEELTRLQSHLDEVDSLLKKGGELGKRLDFLVQEMHREANTLGAKSQALELTNLSMEMKVCIEQMREQVQNIE